MADSFSDAPAKQAAPSGDNFAALLAREPVADTFSEGSSSRTQGGGRQETITDRSGDGRKYPEGVLAKIKQIETRDSAAPSEPAGETPADVTPAADPPTESVAPAEPPPSPEIVEYRSRAERSEAANKALLAEIETLKKNKPAPAAHKLLAEAGDTYIEDQLGGVRKLIAASMGIEDPADKRVDAELRDLFTDLTAHNLGVTPEESHLAKREAARARQLLAREKRERKAEEATSVEKAQADAEAKKADDAATFIGNRLATERDGKAVKDSFPLLHQFAETLDGKKPEALIWEVLQRETKTGRLQLTQDDDANIAAAAKLIESHYQDLAEKLGKARPTTSTAQPQQPTTTSASKDTRPQTQARTLTTADASVAPATPPAAKTETTQRPKFKNDKERREWALRRLPK